MSEPKQPSRLSLLLKFQRQTKTGLTKHVHGGSAGIFLPAAPTCYLVCPQRQHHQCALFYPSVLACEEIHGDLISWVHEFVCNTFGQLRSNHRAQFLGQIRNIHGRTDNMYVFELTFGILGSLGNGANAH